MPATLFNQEKMQNEVVISGVAGCFPESCDIEQFAQKLYNGMDSIYETKNKLMRTKNTEFDYEFFGINKQLAMDMSYQSKCLVEQTYDCIVDSGMVSSELRGSNTGIYVATNQTVQQKMSYGETLQTTFKFNGPLKTFENQYASAFMALNAAVLAIQKGECKQAVLVGCEMVGTEYSFGVIFLQKRSECKRFYAMILDSIMYPVQSFETLEAKKLKEVYASWKIDPSLITYVENYGNPSRAMEEYKALTDVFVPQTIQRSLPVYIGTTQDYLMEQYQKQNFTGIFSLMKIIISIQRGVIPRSVCQQEVNMLCKDVKLVKENTKFYGGLMAFNSFGLNGLNAHFVFQPNTDYLMSKLGKQSYWNQNLNEVSVMPRLFTYSAKTQEGLERIMEEIKRNPTDMAAQFLLNQTTIPTVTEIYRGYCILNANNEVQVIEQIKSSYTKRPVYFVFDGLNADWTQNYQELMKIEAFKQSINQQNEYLQHYGLNLIELITMTPENIRKNALWMLVAHTAIQLAFVDCLNTVGIQAEGLIGHSVGEIACAYADKALSLQQAILVAYQRANAIYQAKLPAGLMAQVGLTWEQAQQRCPSGVMPVYHNSEKMCVISGPREIVQKFIQELTKENIYAKEINSNEMAFNSHQMTSIASEVKASLEKLITKAVRRSSKWISTSIQKQRWSSDLAQYASADYFVHNMCSHVLLYDCLKTIPAEAFIVEIGPQSCMTQILKNLSTKQCIFSLMNEMSTESILVRFWNELGRMYVKGISLNTMNLFVPKNMEQTIYPVPVSTRFLTAKYQQYKDIAHQYKQQLMNKHEQMINNRYMNTMESDSLKMYETKMNIIKNLLASEKVTFQQNKILQELCSLVKMGQNKMSAATLEQELELVQNLYMYYPKQAIENVKMIQELKRCIESQLEKTITSRQEPRMTREEPRMTREEPRMTREEPRMIREEPRMTREEPRMTREETRMTREEQRMTREEPRMTREEPRMTREEPRMIREEPRMTREEPRMTREETRMTREEPRMTREETRMTREETRMTREEPRMTREEPMMFCQEPRMACQTREYTTEFTKFLTVTRMEKLNLCMQLWKCDNIETAEQRRFLEELETLINTKFEQLTAKINLTQLKQQLCLIDNLNMYSPRQNFEETRIMQSLKDIIQQQIKYQVEDMQKIESERSMRMTKTCTDSYRELNKDCESNMTRYFYTIDLTTFEEAYLAAHQIQGKYITPASVYIYLVWKSLAKLHGFENVEKMPVQFYNMKFLQQIALNKTDSIRICVEFNKLTGLFQVLESEKVICTGCVEPLTKLAQLKKHLNVMVEKVPETEMISQNEIYQCLMQRGYELKNEFQPIVKANVDGTYGELAWNGKWIAFIDGMIQMNLYNQREKCQGVVLPTLIKSIKIEPTMMEFETRRCDNTMLTQNWLEEEYQYIMNGKITQPREENSKQQWYMKVQRYQQEYISAIERFLREETLTVSQRKTLEDLLTLIRTYFNKSTMFTTGQVTPIYTVEQLQKQLETVRLMTEMRSQNLESSTFMTEMRQIIKEQLEYLKVKEMAQEQKRTEMNSLAQMLRKMMDIMRTLTQSQCRLTNELNNLVDLERLIQEHLCMHMQQSPVEFHHQQWLNTLERHEMMLNKCIPMINTQELMSIHQYLCKLVQEQLNYEQEYIQERKQMHALINQKLNMNFNLVQKLMTISNMEEQQYQYNNESPIIKKLYLEKLDQLIQEMYEENMLAQAIQESMQETFMVKRTKLNEFLNELVKMNMCESVRPCLFSENMYSERTEMRCFFERMVRELNEFIQETSMMNTLPIYCNGLTKTTVCGGVELNGLCFAPVMTVTPIMTIRQTPLMFTEEPKVTKNELTEMDLLNLIEAMHSMESLKEQSQPISLSAKITTKVTFSPLQAYINSNIDEAERQLIQETLSGMPKKYNYLMPQKCIEPLNNVELYQLDKQTPVFIIHPIEGHTNSLKNLAKYIKSPVYGIQFTKEAMQCETIQELAQFYWSKIQAVFGETKAHICGDAFGAFVAMEMAALRPTACVSLTVLDENNMNLKTNYCSESDALYKFTVQYLPTINRMEFIQELNRYSTLEQRVRYVVERLMSKSQFNFEQFDLENAARAYVTKYTMYNRYHPIQALRMPEIYQIRCGSKHSQALLSITSPIQEVLEQIFSGRMNTQYVDCDYRSFLEGMNGYQVATIMNENLMKYF